jgi:hypothetical protein
MPKHVFAEDVVLQLLKLCRCLMIFSYNKQNINAPIQAHEN